MAVTRAAFAAAIVVAMILASARGLAHKPITSKYTYADDLFPIFRDRCGACHVEGGVAPMSLLTYKDAYPWAESIRQELLGGRMPPWNADESFGALNIAHSLSARELDTILVWASGGTPPGSTVRPPASVPARDWPLGPPDLAIPMPSSFTLAADRMEDVAELAVPTGLPSDRWIRAADLLPGTRFIVRDASIGVRGAAAAGTVLAAWVPGEAPVPTPSGVGFRLPAGATLALRIHYKKTWQYEGKAVTDRSTIGLYFADADAVRLVRSVTIASPAQAAKTAHQVVFGRAFTSSIQILAIRPEVVQPDATLQVEAVRPDGSRAPLVRLTTRPEWPRRYWFARPLALPKGSRIVVRATPPARTDVQNPVVSSRIRVVVDYVRR